MVIRFLSGIYNPLLSIIAMMVIPMEVIYDNPSNMLAKVAHQLGGSQFSTFLSLDAGFVLCGGVLTALVGVSGLLSRLAKDQILPELFSYTNSRGSNYIGIIIFVGLSISLLLAIFDPEDPKGIHDFGGVFAISFLSVLTAFAGGAILLKLYRPHIARLVIAKWWDIIISGIAVIAGLVGNIVLTPDIFYIFLGYLGGLLFVVSYMFYRVEILSFGIWIVSIFFFIPFP
jgi:amino acid transporter